MKSYLDIAQTPTILELQAEKGSVGLYDTSATGFDAMEDAEVTHVTDANSFYMATVNEAGWPYLQHRGGARGFVKRLGPSTIGWAERPGNRQYLGTGNLRANGRVALIFVDYGRRTRLKILGEATYHSELPAPLAETLNPEGVRTDGAIVVDVLATAWNCPKFITPRVEVAEAAAAREQMQARIAELEAEVAELRHGAS